MATKNSRYLAAQAWCKPSTSHIEMDVDLAEAFAEIIDNIKSQPEVVDSKYDKAIDHLYFMWGVGYDVEQQLRFWNMYYPNTHVCGCKSNEEMLSILEMEYIVNMFPEDLIYA